MIRPRTSARDIRGRRVKLGSHVRILKLSPWLLARLEMGDKVRMRSLVGEVLEVKDVDEHGIPWVNKDFGGNGFHSLALDAAEMELVLSNRRGTRKIANTLVGKPR
ncbi:MAG: hypothetical protein K8S25_03000 [Alphaproteobacteria bacterium]|nr:hypothetical protein [Alphaproteobacteria bacterium]